MIEAKAQYIPVSEKELATLIRECRQVNVTLGPRSSLIWREDEPMPEAVERLGYMRGVLNENCEGAGI